MLNYGIAKDAYRAISFLPDKRADREMTINGTSVTVIENQDENRLQLFFSAKPPAEIRNLLKAHGFRWAPSQDAWQRQLNDNARRTLEMIAQGPASEVAPTPVDEPPKKRLA